MKWYATLINMVLRGLSNCPDVRLCLTLPNMPQRLHERLSRAARKL